jgi:hypothetical protein
LRWPCATSWCVARLLNKDSSQKRRVHGSGREMGWAWRMSKIMTWRTGWLWPERWRVTLTMRP